MSRLVLSFSQSLISEQNFVDIFRREGFETVVRIRRYNGLNNVLQSEVTVDFNTEEGAPAALQHFNRFRQNVPSITVEYWFRLGDNSTTTNDQTLLKIPINNDKIVEAANAIIMDCQSLIKKYNETQKLNDIIPLLVKDKKQSSPTKHENFVKYMLLNALNNNSISQIETGKLFAQLITKQALPKTTITQGINDFFNKWSDYLIKYPKFFSNISTIIASLLVSKSACFDFNDLKNACNSISGTGISSIVIMKVLKNILNFTDNMIIDSVNYSQCVEGMFWVYNKWRISEEYVSIDSFMTVTLMNKYFKNDQVGVFLLSMTLYDKMLQTDFELLTKDMPVWIDKNINAEVIKSPHFVRALTIATIFLCLQPLDNFKHFFKDAHIKLLKLYIHPYCLMQEDENESRKIQCYNGVLTTSAVFNHPEGMIKNLFIALHKEGIVSTNSFIFWIRDNSTDGFRPEDVTLKDKALSVFNCR